MKFGKSLNNQIGETLPEWRDKFLSYKDLKRQLKQFHPKRARSSSLEEDPMSREELYFIRLLEDELEKFNTFFVEKEEEYIIRLKEIREKVGREGKNGRGEIMKRRKEIVDFHGEMVLLENYSALNYTGMVKILKKYEKQTGAVLRLPFIHNVLLRQPFFTTDLILKLVSECEALLERLPEDGGGGGRTCVMDDSVYMRSAISAIRVLKDVRSRSSTVNPFSLPPLHGSLFDHFSAVEEQVGS